MVRRNEIKVFYKMKQNCSKINKLKLLGEIKSHSLTKWNETGRHNNFFCSNEIKLFDKIDFNMLKNGKPCLTKRM